MFYGFPMKEGQPVPFLLCDKYGSLALGASTWWIDETFSLSQKEAAVGRIKRIVISRRRVNLLDKRCFSFARNAYSNSGLRGSYHSSKWIQLFLVLHPDYTPPTAAGILNRQFRIWKEVGVLACRHAWENSRPTERKGKVQLKQLLAISPPHPPLSAGNKQSFNTDRYMLNQCYLSSQTNQIMDYSSLVLTLSLSNIFAKVSQFHTSQRMSVYFPE